MYNDNIKDDYQGLPSDIVPVYFDNSEKSKFIDANKSFCNKKNYRYISLGMNIGLSKSYNYVIEKFLSKEDYIIILDSDSKLGLEYFLKVKEYIAEYKNVFSFMPMSFNLKTREYEWPYKFKKGFLIRHERKVPSCDDFDYFMGINNGIVLKKELFEKVGYYDEDLFVYFVDTLLLVKMALKGVKTKIINYKNYCDFSFESTDKSNLKQRMNMLKRDGKVYFKKAYSLLNHKNRWVIHYLLFVFKKAMHFSKNTGVLYFLYYLL